MISYPPTIREASVRKDRDCPTITKSFAHPTAESESNIHRLLKFTQRKETV